jgi:hypothetical protein
MPGSLKREGRPVSDASQAVLAIASDALRAMRKDGFLLYRRFRDVSIARKLYFTVGTMALLIGVELFVLLFCLNTLSSLRAYVGGEGLWSKAQKDAVFHLYQYGVSHTDKDYELFEQFMRIPTGDAKTRRELLAADGNMDVARQGFLEGRNHPDDIDGMIHLFIRFGNISYIRKAISVWGDAQAIVMQLLLRFIRMIQSYSSVMPGLVPGIRGCGPRLCPCFADGRNNSGRDRVGESCVWI